MKNSFFSILVVIINVTLLSSLVFMFSGYIISILNLATTLSSAIWFPLILLFFDKSLSSGRLKDMVFSSTFLAIMFLGGEPSIFYSTIWNVFFIICHNFLSKLVYKRLHFLRMFKWFDARNDFTCLQCDEYYCWSIVAGVNNKTVTTVLDSTY